MSKQMNTYTRVVNRLAKIFKYANEYFFNERLPQPTITVQSSAMSYAHITTDTVWISDRGDSYELNISADYLDRPIEEVVASLLHEMSHLYNIINGIQDVSKNGYYHNKKFKATAEDIARLKISNHPHYGWTITEPTESTLDFIIEYGLQDFKIGRHDGITAGTATGGMGTATPPRKPTGSNSIKWICPSCNAIVRSTRPLNIVCGDCETAFIKAN